MIFKKIPKSKGYIISCNGKVFRNGKPVPVSYMKGYLRFNCELLNGKRACYFVHRLVSQLFVSGYFDGAVVNHKDGIKDNNKFTNLEWVTQSYNVQHAYDNNLTDINKKLGSNNPRSRINEKLAKKICERLKKGERVVRIYERYGLTKSIVLSIKKKKSWVHVSDRFFEEAL